ncbi:MAG: cadherin-like beta sandwich domain-containing protein [Bacilli bacterium]|nr:cadherin-like beta sandwich domain-containing protein [Bacilli bacterium]
MKNKFKYISTFILILMFILFGSIIYSNFKIDKTSKIISYNDSLFDATDASLAALYIYKGSNPSPTTLLHELSDTDFGSDTTFSFDVDWDVFEITLSVAANDPYAKAIGGGKHQLKKGINNIPITVIPKTGSSVVYTVQINRKDIPSGTHTALLYSFTIAKTPEYLLDPTKTSFTYTIPSGWYFIDITTVPYDADNTTITYEGFEYVPETKDCYIHVTNNVTSEKKDYKITLVKKNATEANNYNYNGGTYTFSAPYAGYYKLEAWGAQGGSDGNRGGYGGYSMGIINLDVGNKLYVTVGGAGADCWSGSGGGYNGGGGAGNYGCSGGGGGATHIAYTTGDLKSFKDKMNPYDVDIETSRSSELIMVAGGGGGSGWYSAGGSGGGFKGTKGETDQGGTPGSQANYGNGLSPGAFGQGGNRTNGDGAGGGAGLYGGGAGFGDYGGGGGSGYIGNANLISIYKYTKHMTCYMCDEAIGNSENTFSEIKTYSTTAVSRDALPDYAKRGNGYAQITFLDLSENKYLTDLRVIQPLQQTVIPFDGDEEFAYDNLDYEVTLPANQTKIEIVPRSIDSKMTISGDIGEVRVPGGTHEFKIICTSELGTTTTYTITTHRPPSTEKSVDAINIHGLIENYCKLDFDSNFDFSYNDDDLIDFCQLYAPNSIMDQNDEDPSTNPEKVTWDRNQNDYDLYVPARIKELRFEVVSDNENQSVIGGGANRTLVPGDNYLTIDVVSEACYLEFPELDIPEDRKEECTLGYTYRVYRDYYHDADLSELYIDTSQVEQGIAESGRYFDLNFTDPGVLNYYFSVPYTWDSVKYLNYKADILHENYAGLEILENFNDAVVEIHGNENFEIGKTNIVEIVVHAPDSNQEYNTTTEETEWSGTTQTYYLHVYREYSNNSLLQELHYLNKDVVEIPISPAFSQTKFDYAVTVPTNNDIGYLKFKPQENSTSVRIYNRTTNTELSKSVSTLFIYFSELNLRRGENYIEIELTAEDGEAMSTYTLVVNRLLSNDSSVNDIKAHTDSIYWSLMPDFDPDTTTYDIFVDKGTEYIDFDVTTNDEGAVVEVAEGRYLTAGVNEKTIKITSEDGTTYKTYKFRIHREPYDIATLDNIIVTSASGSNFGEVLTLTPTPFDPGVFSYSLTVPNETFMVDITPVKTNKFAKVNTNYNQNASVRLNEGMNKFTFEVVSESGTVISNYELKIFRTINEDLSLKNLKLDAYSSFYSMNSVKSMNEPVSDTLNEYTVTVEYYYNQGTLQVEPTNEFSNVIGTLTKELNYGPNEFNFTVKNEGETSSLDYKVTVTRIFNPDVGLADLWIEDEWGTQHPLTPDFNPMVLNYTGNISNGSNLVKIHAVPSSKTASVKGTGSKTLNYGLNTYEVKVTNFDSETNLSYTETYELKITRNLGSLACLSYLELYYPISGGRDTKWSRYYPETCESGEYNIYVRNAKQLHVYYVNHYRRVTSVTTDGTWTGFTKGNTYVSHVYVTSQDGSTTNTYTFNIMFPEWVGSKYLTNIEVFDDTDTNIYQLNPAFDKESSGPYTVVGTNVPTLNVPYEIERVNIKATKEDDAASVIGDGWVSLKTGDNEKTITVTSAESGEVMTYTLNINREHGHDATLSDLYFKYNSPWDFISTEEFDLFESDGVTPRPFNPSDTGPYYVTVSSFANPMSNKYAFATATDPNATVNVPFQVLTTGVYVPYDIEVTAEDGVTKITYHTFIKKLMGTDAHGASLCVYNATENKCEEMYATPPEGDLLEGVSFNPMRHDYYVVVNSTFGDYLNTSNVLFETIDYSATTTHLSSPLALVRDTYVTYPIRVVSEDGMSEHIYNVHVKLVLSSDPRIKTVTLSRGFLLNAGTFKKGYDPEETANTEYFWIIDDAYYDAMTDANLEYTMFHPRATSVQTYDADNKIITVNTTSEDGNYSLTYKFMMKKKTKVDVTANSLEIKDPNYSDTLVPGTYPSNYFDGTYKYDPELEDFVFQYTTHIYKSTNELKIDFVPNNPLVNVNPSLASPIPITSDVQDIIFNVTSEDGAFTAPYTIHVIRDIEIDYQIEDLELLDEWNVCEFSCNIRPIFDPTKRVYTSDIPAEYENMFFQVGFKNDQQTAEFFLIDPDSGTQTPIKNRMYNTSEGANDLIQEGYVFPTGLSQVQIIIHDGLGYPTTSYTVMVYKGRSHDASLTDLSVWEVDESPKEYPLDNLFDPNKFIYGIEVPEGTTEVDIRYEKASPNASVIIQGNTGLTTGINQATVTVLAEDEYTQLTYDVYIDVGGSYRSWLASLTVSTGLKFHDLLPDFYKMKTEYTVVVPSETSKVIVEGTPESSEVAVVGNNTYELATGNNRIVITGKYYSSSDPDTVLNETPYIINIYRRYPNNVRLAYLSVEEGSLSPEFDMGTTNYSVTVPAGTNKLTLHYYPEVENASVIVSGNSNLKTGYNIVSLAVISEGGTLTKTYQLSVFVKPSNDATLSMLDVYNNVNKEIRYGVDKFDSKVHDYMIEVPADVDSVYVVGTPSVANSYVEGGGVNGLQYGDNYIDLKITAEDGTATSIYTVNVFRKYNLLLKELNHDLSYPLVPDFDPLVNDYEIEVPYDVKVIQFNAVAQAGSAVTLSYSSVNFLEIGENVVTFIISDPKGNTNVYTVNIKRIGSANNFLANLVPGQGMLLEDFYKTDQTYTLALPNNLKSLDLEDWIIVPEDETSTYEVKGYDKINPESDNNKITITVTSQNGSKRTYTLNIEFRDPAFFKHYLSALWVDDGNLSPKYDVDIISYTVTLPYGTDKTTIHAIPMLESDKVFIDGDETQEKEVNLSFGRNVFKIKVDSGATGYKIYTLIIYRTSAPDPTLASLIVTSTDGSVHTYTPIFNKLITAYYLTIPSSIKELKVNYLPSDPKSTVVVTGYKDFEMDKDNIINVEVTAPDGKTKRTYKIHVTLEADKDNYLTDLQVSGYELKPAFKMTDTGSYEVKVENNVSKVLLYADASSPTAAVTINSISNTYSGIDIVSGTISLSAGNNYVQVAVTADSGDIRTYTVNIFKEYKTISTLKALYTSFNESAEDGGAQITGDGYSPEFNEKTLQYYEEVPYRENGTYTVVPFRTDSSSKMTYSSTTKLKEGINEIPITVTAEDGVTKTTYMVYVTMTKKPSSKLKDLLITEGEIDPVFDPDTYTYYVEVPNEITSLSFYNEMSNPIGKGYAIPEDEDSTVSITGNSGFTENGISTVTITVTNQNAVPSTTTYKVEVYRSIAGDEKLSNLYIKDYPMSPSYSPLTLFYQREVESTVDFVTVGAFRSTEDATISIDGVTMGGTGGEKLVNLDFGKNYVHVKVVASNGAKRTYTIEITRKDTANFLTELTSNAGEWTFTPTETSLKTKFDYELTLPNGVTEIKLKGNWSEGATVDNLDKVFNTVTVPPASNLLYKINVTSASGEINTYTITIHGAVSGETDIDLDTDKGKPSYLGDNKYELTVKDDDSTIVLDVKTKDEGATVKLQPFYALKYGETVITFTVTSSDGSETQTYTLTVTRGKDIEKIVPSDEEIVIVVSEEYTLTYTIEPPDATSTDVTFVSLDNTIASVDQDGKVTGLKEGVTKVEIRSVKDPEIKGIVSVFVLNKKIMSDTYHVVHKDETDNQYNLYNLDYVFGAQPKTKIDDFLDNFTNPATYLHVYSNGVELTDYTQFVGSCLVLKLEIAGKLYDEITIIVKSDIGTLDSPGDGINSASDVSTANSVSSGILSATNIYKAIIDVNNDGVISASDISVIDSYNKSIIKTI